MQYKNIEDLGEVRKRRGITYYHQLYSLLTTALNDGVIPAGSILPSESELMEHFQVSRNTVRRALGQLEQDKRIIRRRGSGSYARRTQQSELSTDSIAEIIYDFNSVKSQSASRLIRVKTIATPEFIRRKDPEFGEMSLLIQRCRSLKSEPFMFSTSYVPQRLSTRLTRQLLGRQVVLGALETLGVKPTSAEQTTTATLADSFTARHLQVEPATALLCIHRLVRDGEGRSIEHQTHLYRPDRWQLQSAVSIERSAAGLRWIDASSPRLPAAL
jgi:GntR family transcriptional regulator